MSSLGRNVAFAVGLISGLCSQATAQSPTRPSRPASIRYDGWSPATTAAEATALAATTRAATTHPAATDRDAPVRQVAFYQAQGGLSDLPELPGLSGFPGGELPSRGGAMEPASQLPDYGRGGVSTAGGTGEILPPSEQVLPPVNSPRSDYAIPGYAGQGVDARSFDGGRATAQARERSLPASSAAFQQNAELQRGNAELRPIDPMQQRMGASQGQFGGALQNQVANGLPFVTPPPRTGRYPTSPYLGPRYQLTNYQLRTIPAQTVAAQTVATQNGLSVPNALAAAAQQPVLPQNRNVVGIYPTAYQQCAPGAATSYPATGAVPGTFVPPTYPANLTPGLYSPNNSGYSPLFSLGQENYNVMLGRGLIGQPTVYVPGQPFRNFFRYISP